MPCYVIAHTRFPEIRQFRSFRTRLEAMADGVHLRLVPLRDSPSETEDQAVMMEFDTAETAWAFMCSPDYRRIARPDEAWPAVN